jgi:hypothetical protein
MATRILLALLLLTGVASAQAPQQLKIGIFAPSVEFDTAQARLAYVQGLGKAIEQNTGIRVQAYAYSTLGALKKDNLDFAIVESVCYATNGSWQVLANAKIDNSTSRQWALFASGADSMLALRGKKLAYMQTGCNDAGFIDNAMLDSEVDKSFFGARQGANDLRGAIASVSSYKTAQAVFAPTSSSAKSLTKLFDTGVVPNPAFVQIDSKLPDSISSKVAAAVIGYGGGGAISGWARGERGPFAALEGQLRPVTKTGVFAGPESVRLQSNQVLIDPPTIKDFDLVSVRQHFQRSSARLE